MGSVREVQNREQHEKGQQVFAQPLVPQARTRHKRKMSSVPPQIFDNKRRMAMRLRALSRGTRQSFLLAYMANELAERLACVSRSFENTLLLGPIAQFADIISGDRQMPIVADVMANEETLSYPPQSFDLIISAGTLDSVNDLPGALVQIRRTLEPDGLFLGTLYGAGSLATLKSAMLKADGAQIRPHIHPQIDLRAISDLMGRTGFALPVIDRDKLDVRYNDWRTLVADVRDAAAGNSLVGSRSYVRSLPKELEARWNALADHDGKVRESFHFLHISGWAPSPTQRKPAARGSGTVSLVDIFKKSDG
jgi:NADH dehydrogenase [ubiquinone] 1 alpha subcomplex assembly factor 5